MDRLVKIKSFPGIILKVHGGVVEIVSKKLTDRYLPNFTEILVLNSFDATENQIKSFVIK